jgi:hypothetical protein
MTCRLKWHESISVGIIRSRNWVARRARPLLRPGVLAVGVTGAIFSACQILRSQDQPSASAWRKDEPLNYVLVSSGVVTAICGALVLWGYSRLLKQREENEDLENACKGAWHLAVRELAIPGNRMEKIGVHVWSVRGFKGARVLTRRAKFTLQPRKETRVLWRKGTGAIGTAWDRGEALIANIENLELLGPTEREFCELDPSTRYGLNWRQFQKSRHYRAILVIPLETQPDKVAGCLSIDIQLDGYADRLDTLTKVDQLSTIRDICERALGG